MNNFPLFRDFRKFKYRLISLNKSNILLDRKILSDLAINDASTFEKIVKTAVN